VSVCNLLSVLPWMESTFRWDGHGRSHTSIDSNYNIKLGKSFPAAFHDFNINVQLRDDGIPNIDEYLHRVCEARRETQGKDRGYE